MSNGKTAVPGQSLAYYDFNKTNGASHLVYTEGPSLTRQEFADECDINTLMRRYETHATGVNGLPRASDVPPFYADFSEMPNNLLDYLGMVKEAETAFMTLPAGVRKQFDNDALAFVDFASDPTNLDQMRSWGLAKPAPAPEPAAGKPSSPAGSVVPPAAPDGPAAAGGASTHGST